MRYLTKFVLLTIATLASACGSSPETDTSEEAVVGNVASFESVPTAIATDDARVYWAVSQGRSAGIYSKGKLNGLLSKKVASSPEGARVLAVDDARVYWAIGDHRGEVFSAPKEGGPETKLGASPYATGIAVDAEAVYVAGQNVVRRFAKSGEVSDVVAGNFLEMTADSTHLYLVSVVASGNYEVVSIPKRPSVSPSEVKVLEGKAWSRPAGLTVDANHVYFASSKAESQQPISKIAKNGGRKEELPSAPLTSALKGGVVSADTLCFADANNISCQRAVGGPPVKVAEGTDIRAVTFSEGHVFWTQGAESSGATFMGEGLDIPSSGSVHRAPVRLP